MTAAAEEVRIKTVRDPGSPTPAEKERHDMTHNPYRSWCPVCVEARGKEDPHYRNKGDKREGINVVGMDYLSFGQEADDDKITMIVIRDKEALTTFAHPCLTKGASDEWVVKEVQEDLALLGYPRIILKTDGEPSLVQVQAEVIRQSPKEVIPQNPPAYDPQSNGVIEHCVDEVMGQVRALKIALERRIKRSVKTEKQ